MKRIFLLVLILLVQSFMAMSKEYINPDGGNWITIDSVQAYYDSYSNAPSYYYNLCCYDSLNCIGHYGDFLTTSQYSRIRKTTDGGNNWFDIRVDTSPPTYPKRRFIFYPEKDLIIIGCDSGYVLRSTDGGSNWDYSQKITTLEPFYFQLNTMYMKGNIGIMSYSGIGNVFITKDGGENWMKMQFNTVPEVRYPAAFGIVNSNTLIMSSWVNTVNDTSMYFFKSNDKGETWSQISKFQNKDNFYSFFTFINEKVAFSRYNKLIVKGDMMKGTSDTSLTTFHKTTDGGVTWNKIYEIITQGDGYGRIVANDELNFIAKNLQAGYIKTTDGGTTWEKSDYFTFGGEYQGGYSFSEPVYLAPKNPLITSGPRILKYVGKSTSVNYNKIEKQEFLISPNPAGNYITIKLGAFNPILNVGVDEATTIYIYNTFGEKVMTESIHPMTGSHRMNIESLPKGIYFVKVGSEIAKFVKM